MNWTEPRMYIRGFAAEINMGHYSPFARRIFAPPRPWPL
jgi:hypothetical protein